jgi:hypothetical protein
MLNKFRKNTEEETIQDKKRELECEEEIIAEKRRFGRVRNPFMEYMREKYGRDLTDRTLGRINKRISKGYFKQKRPFDTRASRDNSTVNGNNYEVY